MQFGHCRAASCGRWWALGRTTTGRRWRIRCRGPPPVRGEERRRPRASARGTGPRVEAANWRPESRSKGRRRPMRSAETLRKREEQIRAYGAGASREILPGGNLSNPGVTSIRAEVRNYEKSEGRETVSYTHLTLPTKR